MNLDRGHPPIVVYYFMYNTYTALYMYLYHFTKAMCSKCIDSVTGFGLGLIMLINCSIFELLLCWESFLQQWEIEEKFVWTYSWLDYGCYGFFEFFILFFLVKGVVVCNTVYQALEVINLWGGIYCMDEWTSNFMHLFYEGIHGVNKLLLCEGRVRKRKLNEVCIQCKCKVRWEPDLVV